jgi:hypothetical protein
MEKTVKIFEKNKFQEIRVGISEYQGNDLIDIRVWTATQAGQERVPTAKGVSLNVKLFPQLKEAVLLLEAELKSNKLL